MTLFTLFPSRPRPRTVVHAGPLLLRRRAGVRALRRFLRAPRARETFLVHQGQPPLRDVARDAGVTDISLEASVRKEADAAAEMAVALGARRLCFAIDEPSVSRPDGALLREVTATEAERLARQPELRPKIRTKLRAAATAIRHGVSLVRIGDPEALTSDRATRIVPDGTEPVELAELPPPPPRPSRSTAAAAARSPGSGAELHHPWGRLRSIGARSTREARAGAA